MTLNELNGKLGQTIDKYTDTVRSALDNSSVNQDANTEMYNLINTIGVEVKQALDDYRINIIEYLRDK